MEKRRLAGSLLSLILMAGGPAAFAQSPGPETAPETRNSQLPLAPSQPAKAVKTSLEMKVHGILAIGEGDDRRSSAIIAMKGQGKTYSPGQIIDDNPDLKLVKIQDDRIEFINKGQLEFAPVKRFPDAGYGGGGGGSSAPPAYSAAAEPKDRDAVAAPARPTFSRPRPIRRPPPGQGDTITPSGAQE
ncbi:MAG TPA: type II secretion system protein N [bacterium]|nr:type II secretion system protein N [bacterium]